MKKLSYLFLIMSLFSCTNMPYKNALRTFKHHDYSLAIKQFDNFITPESGNPALKVEAKQLRSECYYELGEQEIKKGNFSRAADLLFLANFNKADKLLDNCYYLLSQECIQRQDYTTAYNYFNFITDNLLDSELMPEILSQKLKLEFEIQNSPEKSYKTYQTLQDSFPNSMPYKLSKKIVDQYIPDFIEKAKKKWHKNEFNASLEQLFSYLQYPADYKAEIKSMIGDVYFSWADTLLKNGKLSESEQNLRLAEKYNPQKTDAVIDRLNQICKIHIKDGDRLLAEREIDEAIASYQVTFSIIKNYKIAKEKIKIAQEIAANIKKAEKLTAKGNAHFNNKEYQMALKLYSQAYKLDKTPFIKTKVNKAYIWLRISTNPEKYARELVQKHNNGIILRQIAKVEKEAIKKFSRKSIKVTPWQVLRSPARNSFEVRYSIITPERNYFLLWLVKLETGEIIPLNKTTEEFIK